MGEQRQQASVGQAKGTRRAKCLLRCRTLRQVEVDLAQQHLNLRHVRLLVDQDLQQRRGNLDVTVQPGGAGLAQGACGVSARAVAALGIGAQPGSGR